jgi:hypothetical protein
VNSKSTGVGNDGVSFIITITAKHLDDTMLLGSPNWSQPFDQVVCGTPEYPKADHDHEQI